MSRFITTFDTTTINLDQITCIHFDPYAKEVLTIYTTNPELTLKYGDSAKDRRAMLDLIRDIKFHISSMKQPEYFYRMLKTIERWLSEENKE